MTLRKAQTWIGAGLVLVFFLSASRAQDVPATAAQQAEQQAALQEKALKLLDEVIVDAQSLRLPENRIRIQIRAGDLLWERDETRARALFAEAATTLTGMLHSISGNEREYFRQLRTPTQLREELLRVVAQHDPKLALEILQSTRPPEPSQTLPFSGRPSAEAELELSLLAKIAAADPALALRRAEELLEKGQYPHTLIEMLAQLRSKDEKAAAGLTEKILGKLRTETMLSSSEAGNLALAMLRPGPLPATSSGSPQTKSSANTEQVLSETDYRKLLNNLIAAALKATPRLTQAGQAANAGRGGQRNLAPGVPPTPPNRGQGRDTNQADPTQNNARRLLTSLSSLLPQVDKYAPGYGPAVRQKLAENGQANNPRQTLSQYSNVLRQGTADEVIQAAAAAPPTVQPMLYQQAAMKALSEGQPDRARDIVNQHVPENQRNPMLQMIERRQLVSAAAVSNIEQARQSLVKLRSDEERVDVLTRMASNVAKQNNPKLALQLVEEARSLANRRAENYEQLEAQLKVARAYAELDPVQGIELLETSIDRLNELLPAAALLEGFEVRVFREGELPLQGGGRLGQMVSRIGQELATLASKDFERAQAAAEKFQRAEPRTAARLSVVQGILGAPAPNPSSANFNQPFGPRGGLGRRP